MVMHLPVALAAVSPAVNNILGGEFRYLEPHRNPNPNPNPDPNTNLNRQPDIQARNNAKMLKPPLHSIQSCTPGNLDTVPQVVRISIAGCTLQAVAADGAEWRRLRPLCAWPPRRPVANRHRRLPGRAGDHAAGLWCCRISPTSRPATVAHRRSHPKSMPACLLPHFAEDLSFDALYMDIKNSNHVDQAHHASALFCRHCGVQMVVVSLC